MTNDDIEKIAQRVADLLYKKANEHLRFEIAEEDQEQMLLAELAKAMTLLDSYLIKEEYDKCANCKIKLKE